MNCTRYPARFHAALDQRSIRSKARLQGQSFGKASGPVLQSCTSRHQKLSSRASHPQNPGSQEPASQDILESGPLPEAPPLIAQNPMFAAALQGALKRRGSSALSRSAQIAKENKPSPAEEVLLNGLRESRRNVLRLEHLKRQLEEAIEMEEKQFERFQFGLRRATADAAYIRTLQKMRAASKDAQDE